MPDEPKILAQDVRRTDSGTAAIIDGVAQERIVSVHDPDMRHGRKSSCQRFDGYKASVVVNTESQLVTGVDVLAGNDHDATNAEDLLQQTEQNTEAIVETVIGDSAYGSVEQRVTAQEQDRRLIAPVPKAPTMGRFTKEDFQIDLTKETVICLAGKSTSLWYEQKRRTKRGTTFRSKAFRFGADQCQGCPLAAQCVNPGARWRSVSVHEHEALMQAAKQFQRTEQFRQLYRERTTVEHRIARLVQLGLSKARYFGKAKVLFQLAMTAVVANLTLIASRAQTVLLFVCLFLHFSGICFFSSVRAFLSEPWSLIRPKVANWWLKPTTNTNRTQTWGFRPCF